MDKDILKAAVNTLNTISVRGKNDLDAMLGVILALEDIINAPEKEEVVESDGR